MSRERPASTDAMRLVEMSRVIDALRAGIAERDARIAALSEELALNKAVVDAPKVAGESVYVLRTKLRLNGIDYPKGAEMPFDPKSPPDGCTGYVEGVHYDRARIVVRHAHN